MMTRNDGDHETVVYSHCTNRFEHHIVAPRNLVMEFSEYLQWDRVAPFFAPPCSVGAKLACHANSFFFRNSVVIETGSSPHRYRCHSILNLLSLQLFVSSTWTLHRETIQNIFRGLRLIGLVRLIFYQWLFSVMSNDAKCALSIHVFCLCLKTVRYKLTKCPKVGKPKQHCEGSFCSYNAVNSVETWDTRPTPRIDRERKLHTDWERCKA